MYYIVSAPLVGSSLQGRKCFFRTEYAGLVPNHTYLGEAVAGTEAEKTNEVFLLFAPTAIVRLRRRVIWPTRLDRLLMHLSVLKLHAIQ
jgi:hypothetical protein